MSGAWKIPVCMAIQETCSRAACKEKLNAYLLIKLLHALVCGAETCIAIKLSEYLVVCYCRLQLFNLLFALGSLIVYSHGLPTSVGPKKNVPSEGCSVSSVDAPSNVSYRGPGRLVFLPCGA